MSLYRRGDTLLVIGLCSRSLRVKSKWLRVIVILWWLSLQYIIIIINNLLYWLVYILCGWIVIYPLDSVIGSLNNRDLIVGLFNSDLGGHCTDCIKTKNEKDVWSGVSSCNKRGCQSGFHPLTVSSRPVPSRLPVTLTCQVPAFICICHWRVEMRSLYFILIQLAYILPYSLPTCSRPPPRFSPHISFYPFSLLNRVIKEVLTKERSARSVPFTPPPLIKQLISGNESQKDYQQGLIRQQEKARVHGILTGL